MPFGIGFIFIGMWALWSQRTTGNPLHAPYGLYSRYYFPDDVMGFGLTGLKPLRPLNADMAQYNEFVKILHRGYTLESLPMNLRARIIAIAANMWATRAVLMPLAALALVTTSAPIWFALGTIGAARARVHLRGTCAAVGGVLRGDPAGARVRDGGGVVARGEPAVERRSSQWPLRERAGAVVGGGVGSDGERGCCWRRTARVW